jgi:hypothetical protein
MLQATEKRLDEATERMNLTLEMAKQKYEKQIQSIKFRQFAHRDPHEATLHPEGL